MKLSFNEKLYQSKNMPYIVNVKEETAFKYGGSKMLIAAPLQYDEIAKMIPNGKITTIDRVRTHLAKIHKADFTCPLTAGIFMNIVAQASVERGGVDETPYYRVLKKNGELNDKYPGGLENQKIILEKEGHKIKKVNFKYYVEKYEEKLFTL